jgi:hypothetical protein
VKNLALFGWFQAKTCLKSPPSPRLGGQKARIGKFLKFLENLWKFGEILENFGKFWKPFGKFWKMLENFGKFLENFGKFWKIQVCGGQQPSEAEVYMISVGGGMEGNWSRLSKLV